MKLISHRGNIDGRQPNLENKPEYILKALNQGYECEIDVWFIRNKIYLGHDKVKKRMVEINLNFLKNKKLWCHAKNIEALDLMRRNNVHCFWHEDDLVTITSKGWIWCHPRLKIGRKNSITVLPELHNTQAKSFSGICSDFISKYR
jgi:hypothetical protein